LATNNLNASPLAVTGLLVRFGHPALTWHSFKKVLGLVVGDDVGLSVGASVGFGVGADVGGSVDVGVGWNEGDGVGRNVGAGVFALVDFGALVALKGEKEILYEVVG
jgi:hypothetical protein